MIASIIVCLVALIAVALTLFSGSGLGGTAQASLLYIIPVIVAVGATAVHLLQGR